jgi:hypothetical protein
MTAQDHNRLLSIFLFIHAGLQAFAAVVLMAIYIIWGVMFGAIMTAAGKGEEKMIGPMIGVVFVVFAIGIGLFILMFALLHYTAGRKLQKMQPGARTWATISCCLAVLGFPLGTALGIYGFWFLYGDMGKQIYGGGNQPQYYPPPPPPSNMPPTPGNWR